MKRALIVCAVVFLAGGSPLLAGEAVGAVLRLELGAVEEPKLPEPERLLGEVRPSFDLVRGEDGRLTGSYGLRLGRPGSQAPQPSSAALPKEAVEVMLSHLEAYLKDGGLPNALVGDPDKADCFYLLGSKEDEVFIDSKAGGVSLNRQECAWAVATLRQSFEDCRLLEEFLESGRADGPALKALALRGWTLEKTIGWLDLPVLKLLEQLPIDQLELEDLKHQGRVPLVALASVAPWPSPFSRKSPKFFTAEDPQGEFHTAVMLPGQLHTPVAPIALVAALAEIPGSFRAGQELRWEEEGMLLRAFPENSAIFLKPEVKRKREVRIQLETAKEAERLFKERDALWVWYRDTARPALEALMKDGDPAIFDLWK